MRYQASAIRAKPVRPGLRSPPPSTAPNALPISSQTPSSLVPEIAPLVLGTYPATFQQSSHQLAERMYFMATVGHCLVLTISSRLFYILDVRSRIMDALDHTPELSQIPNPHPRLHVLWPRYFPSLPLVHW